MSSEFIKTIDDTLSPDRFKPLCITPLMPGFAARVDNIDVSRPLSEDIKLKLREALLRFGVLFFENQEKLSTDAQIAFASVFGTPDDGSPFIAKIAKHVDILITDKQRPPYANLWHADNTGVPHSSFGTLIQIQECPPIGGNTAWSSARKAYECLSNEMKAYLDQLVAIHYWDNRGKTNSHDDAKEEADFDKYFDRIKTLYPQKHPVIMRHPITGSRSIFVNEVYTKYIKDRHAYEGDAILEFLFKWNKIPEFHVVHHWQKNDVAVWDNFSMQHYALADYEAFRVNQRVEFAIDPALDYGHAHDVDGQALRQTETA